MEDEKRWWPKDPHDRSGGDYPQREAEKKTAEEIALAEWAANGYPTLIVRVKKP